MDGNVNLAAPDLVDILKRRQIERVYYFHTDHFEPWSLGLNEKTARGVERFAEMSRSSPFARKLSIFYCPYIPYNLTLPTTAPTIGHRIEGDAMTFGLRSDAQDKLALDVIRPLAATDGHEFHLHVHHEFWTRNESNFDNPVSRWVNANSTAEMDRARLDLFFKLCTTVIGHELDKPFDRWAFIHGNWALAASDPLICTIENELGMIMRHGGFGDFSFPAGRGYCDPKLPAPFTCLPIEAKRAYDDPASDPRVIEAGSRVLKPDRFFIWNSLIKAKFSSLDYYSAPNRDLFKERTGILSEWLRNSVSFGSGLFLKTHAHSMKWEYKISEDGSPTPHCYPDVVKIFEDLLRACDKAGVDFVPVTVNEVMELVTAHDSGEDATVLPPLDRAKLTTSAGVAAAPPTGVPASPRAERATAPTGRKKSGRQRKAQSRPKTLLDKTATLEDRIKSALGEWLSADPVRVEGAGDFYRQLLDEDQILQDYERAVLDYVVATFPRERTTIVEVGVGYGILSLLLAANGYDVIAFEGQSSRFAGLQFLSKSMAKTFAPSGGAVRPVFGWFPDAFSQSMLEQQRCNLMITTNIVATASAKRQEVILQAAALFDELIIDTTRFGVTRYDEEVAGEFRDRLAATFRPVGAVWHRTPNEIWHFRTSKGNDNRMPPDSAKVADGTAAGASSARPPLDYRPFNDEFVALQRVWMTGEGAVHQPDDLYSAKLARGVALEAYEEAISSAIADRFDRKTEIVEIGAGYGALSLRLAQEGFSVHGCEGDRRRFAACTWHVEQYLSRHGELAGRVDCVAGFFPDVLPTSGNGKAAKRLCVATNITCTYTATHQAAILDAMRGFDDVIIDLSRFGRARNDQVDRDALREDMAKSIFEPVEKLYFSAPYEYWRFRVRPAARLVQGGASVPTATQLPAPASRAADATFPLKGQSGVLYSVHGGRHIHDCPICHGTNTTGLWRIPLTSLKEPINLFGGYFNQVPTLQVPGTVYCFDFCRDCESIYLNPAPLAQKEQYRKSDHYLRTMKDNEREWRSYENVYDRFAKWIPEGASTFMDAACGIGQYLHVARKREPERWRRYIGLELSEKYVDYMRSENFEAYAFDIDNDAISDFVAPESVDFITFCEAFEHVERPLDALEKLLSTLKPGGRLFFTAQRYGSDVQAAVRPGEPIYIGERVMKELPQRLGCKLIDVVKSGSRYFSVIER